MLCGFVRSFDENKQTFFPSWLFYDLKLNYSRSSSRESLRINLMLYTFGPFLFYSPVVKSVKIFYGFISLWPMLFSWHWIKADTICLIHNFNCSISIPFSVFFIYSSKVPPSTKSITRNIFSSYGSLITSIIFIIFGWYSVFSASNSVNKPDSENDCF